MFLHTVLTSFSTEVRDCIWTPLPLGGGMSGGQVWRGDLNGVPRFALKRWPICNNSERMRFVHARIKTAANFQFVPHLEMTQSGQSLVECDDHCWDVTTWKSGTPDLLGGAFTPHLKSAGLTLAELHRAWMPTKFDSTNCSAISRRLQLFADWENTRFSFLGQQDEVVEVERTLDVVRTRLPDARAKLRRQTHLQRPAIGIHGDYWPENVLFDNSGKVAGVIDYGNVGYDHPEVDLGRLLADVPWVNSSAILAAVEAYNSIAPFELSAPLVELLAISGRLGSLANWQLRLNAGSPDVGLMTAALPRIRRLVSLIRMESCSAKK